MVMMVLIKLSLVAIEKPEECTKSKVRKLESMLMLTEAITLCEK